ncbi:MAG: NAD(P)-binding protein [Polyangiales bacterium]
MSVLETDYLIVGAGASGMAFADVVISESDADVVLVDRRCRPGGHWNDAYPFVRLHQPSAYYGVASRTLGDDAVDEVGPNAGFYERATAAQICDYYQRVLDEHLLASGRVRFYGMHDYVAARSEGHRLVSRLTGQTTTVRVRRKLVDASYLETSVPSTHTPSFEVEPSVRFVTPNELVGLACPGSGYTIVGAGKTAMDTCVWLLDNGVPPEDIRWIRPRDPWTLDRRYWQPLSQLPWLIEGLSLQYQAAAEAEDVPDLFRRLENSGQLVRLDPDVEPEVFRGATTSADERYKLGQIDDVHRGRVARIAPDRISTRDGTIPTDPDRVHVDCTARGLNQAPTRPVFEPDRITMQWVQWGVLPFSAALIGFVEASGRSDADKNRLCPPSPPLNEVGDWVRACLVTMRAQAEWRNEPDVNAWSRRCRLNLTRGMGQHREDPRMQSALDRLLRHAGPAAANLERLAT